MTGDPGQRHVERARGELDLRRKPTVVMIQCVEQRTSERPYCSRVCCATAVKNALLLRERFPASRIVVLYRDMRTYGFREAAYREAAQAHQRGVKPSPRRMLWRAWRTASPVTLQVFTI